MPRKLDIAFWNYDQAEPLRSGSVAIDGVEPTFHNGRIVTDIFERMVKDRAYDVSDLGFSYFLRTMDFEKPPFLALPVFTARVFRHSAIYINRNAGIERPQDLAGKRIGELALYGHDAGVWPKGILSDDYGVKPEQSRWLVGGIDFPLKPIDWIPRPHPAGMDVEQAADDVDLGELLRTGELDALISADAPEAYLKGDPAVGRLFENHVEVERDYFHRTGIFPMMHMIVVKRELAECEPELVKAVYEGFKQSKAVCQERFVRGMTFNNITTMVPWLSALLAEARKLLGDDWWPYGMRRNRTAVDIFLRYHHEQGLSKRRWTIEEVFVPYLLGD